MTTAALEYTIVVPSRKRPHNMARLLSLLPSAIVCVDEREESDYRPVVPSEQLRLHPPLPGGAASVRNWMMDAFDAPILIQIDDDFTRVIATTGSKRTITDSEEILAILENGARACQDLGLSTFCFSRTPNTSVIRPEERPFVPTQGVFAAFGIMGAARHRKYDRTLLGRADVDWTLQTLLDDRCVLADVRFYFDCGSPYGGGGGGTGIVTNEAFQESTRELRRRWGRCLSFKAPGYRKNKRAEALRIAVSRTNARAQR